MSKETIILYVMSLVGLPYRWGGNSPVSGFDCSGLVIEILRAEDQWPFADDTSQGIFAGLSTQGWRVTKQTPEFGDVVFYGKSVNNITHVGYVVANGSVIEAAGGGRKTLTVEDAIRDEAFVRLRPYRYRKDLVAVLTRD